MDAAALQPGAVVTYGGSARGAVEYRDTEDSWQTEETEAAFLQLALERDSLAEIIGTEAVERLWAMARTHAQRTAPDRKGLEDLEPHNIFARRYTPFERPWCPFHHDVSLCTVNIALSDDASHRGGRLLAVFDGRVHALERSEGGATVHPSSLLHGVSRMTDGVRYSLILFAGQICPHSDHSLELVDAAEMAARYPPEAGSYHCDGCGASAAELEGAGMHHCGAGCDYALCAACAEAPGDEVGGRASTFV